MSKFYFDENKIHSVKEMLKTSENNINTCVKELGKVHSRVSEEYGFGVDTITGKISILRGEIENYTTSFTEAQIVLEYVIERVKFYSGNASSNFAMSVLNHVQSNTDIAGRFNTVFDDYYGYGGDFVNKYTNMWTVASQIWTAFKSSFDGGYEKYLLKKTIKDIIDSTAENITLDFENENEFDIAGDVDGVMSDIDDEYEGLEFFKYYKLGKIGRDTFVILANDYSQSMEYLNSLERSLKMSGFDEDTLSEVMSEIRTDYNNKYMVAAENIIQEVADELIDDFLKNNPISKTVVTILEIMELTDICSDSKMEFSAMLLYEGDAIRAYEALGEKIISGNYTEQDLVDYQNMFELCRSIGINKYETALDFVSGEDVESCNEALDYYKNLKMN